MRHFLYRAMQAALVLILAAIIWGGWYVYYRGFGRTWRQFVVAEFRKRGIELSMRRLTLDPFQGIVAREVKIVDERHRDKVLAVVDQLVLDINYSNLLHGEPFLNAIGLSDTSVALPLDPSEKDSPRVEITRLNALVVLPPHQVYVSHLEADLYGIHVSAAGRIINPEKFKPAPAAPDRPEGNGHAAIVRAIAEIKKLKFGNGAPRINIRFSGDAAEPEKIFVEASLWADEAARGGYHLENVYAALNYRDGVLRLDRCTANDSRGAFDLSGVFTPATGAGDFQLRCGLDLQAIEKTLKLTKDLDEFVFYEAPTIDLTGHAALNGSAHWEILGRLDLAKFAFRSIMFDKLGANFSWDGKRWYIRNFALAHRSGTVTAHAMQLPGDFRATLLSTIDPKALLPLTSGKTAEMLGAWEFSQTPRVQLQARGPSPSPNDLVADGTIELGRSQLRGIPLNRAATHLRIANKAVTYENFRIERSEGTGTGTFAYDFGKHEVRLDGVKSSLVPGDVAAWIDPRLAHDVAPYRFRSPPQLTINGFVGIGGNKNTRLEIGVNSPGGLDYIFLKKNLPFQSISGNLLFTEGKLQMSNVVGALYGGQLRGSADISLDKAAPGYSAHVEADRVDFASVTKLYFRYDTAHGEMAGRFDFSGKPDARTLLGKGGIEITNGDVFNIPVMGPFSGILNSIVPGMGYNIAHKAKSSFVVRDGIISTDDFVVEGQGFSMFGEGKLHFLDDKIDFNIRINAQGLPGVLLFPVSKLFEFSAESSLSKPVWKPRRLPAL